MKILFFVGEFPKLSQTFILNQITGLMDAGCDVRILAKKAETNTKMHEDVLKYHLLERVLYYGRSGKSSRFDKMIQFLTGVVHYYLHNNDDHRKAGLKDFIKYPNLVLLLNFLKQQNLTDVDVIHAHFGPNGLLAQKLTELGLLHGKLFTTFHGYDMLKYIRKNGEDAYRELFSGENILLPISEYWKKRCIQLGARPNRIVVHHMGIDVGKFAFSFAKPQLNQKINILSVARFVEKKGLVYGIAAVGRLLNQEYQIEYSIVGGGPLAKDLINSISKGGWNENIRLLGWKSQGELIDIMKEAHIILLPSVTSGDGDMEGIPVLLMEAMAMGKIVVSTDHSGIPELIRHEVNGYLVQERDVEGLSQTIQGILSSVNSWEEIAEKARQTILEQFNIGLLNKQLLDIFEGKPSE